MECCAAEAERRRGLGSESLALVHTKERARSAKNGEGGDVNDVHEYVNENKLANGFHQHNILNTHAARSSSQRMQVIVRHFGILSTRSLRTFRPSVVCTLLLDIFF